MSSRKQVHFQWHNDEVHFVLEKHAEVHFVLDKHAEVHFVLDKHVEVRR